MAQSPIQSLTAEAAREKFALFFFLVFGDERRVYAASIESFQYINGLREELSSQRFIQKAQKILKKFKDKTKTEMFHEVEFVNSSHKKNQNMEKWNQIRQQVDAEELALLVYIHQFGFSYQDVSQALELAEGTLRYRVRNLLILLAQVPVGKLVGNLSGNLKVIKGSL